MKILFFINKEKVYEEVMKMTEYIGAKNDEYERLTAVPEDEDLLNLFWDEACNDLYAALRHFEPIIDFENENKVKGLQIEITLPENWDDKLQNMIHEDMKKYLIAKIYMQWMATAKGKDNATEEGPENIVNRILISLFVRKRPIRPIYEEDCENEI